MCQDYWGKAYSYLEGPLSPNQTRTELAINMIFLWTLSLWDSTISPLIPTSDQDRISPYNINKISNRQVMRIKKESNERVIAWYDTKFSTLA